MEDPEPSLAPIFILADDDREAIHFIQKWLDVEWTYVSIWKTREVVHYARQFATTAVFLADPIGYPGGGAERLLQDLLDQVGKPVIILAEIWSPEVAEKWKRLGALDCIPHPTRLHHRVEGIRMKMEELALAGLARTRASFGFSRRPND
jgi:hypothetical protein